jgi:hypothetical protein
MPELAKVGVTLNIVKKGDWGSPDLYGGADDETLLIPAFTTQSGKLGVFKSYCSGEWKRDVAMRWKRAQGVEQCDTWIGFSVDEISRCFTARRKWDQPRYPLIFDLPRAVQRSDCLKIVAAMGWPPPPRSSCWMCPFHGNSEWRDIRDNWPEDWAQAVAFDKALRLRDPHVFVHSSGVPLDEADLEEAAGLFSPPSGCSSGQCYV